jgi:hypothetical protein
MFFTQCSFLSSSNLDFESDLFDRNLKVLADSVIRGLKVHYERCPDTHSRNDFGELNNKNSSSDNPRSYDEDSNCRINSNDKDNSSSNKSTDKYFNENRDVKCAYDKLDSSICSEIKLHTLEIKTIKTAVLDIIVTKNDFNTSTGLSDSSNKYR